MRSVNDTASQTHLCIFLAQSIVATGGASSHPPDSAVSHTTCNFACVG